MSDTKPLDINVGAIGATAITAVAYGDDQTGGFDTTVLKGSSTAVVGKTDVGSGIEGHSETGAGVMGLTRHGFGVVGDSGVLLGGGDGTGVLGRSHRGRGVWGQSEFIATVGDSTNGTGVWGHSINGTGVYGLSEKGIAGHFEGDVEVTGDIRLKNSDCAEEFQIADGVSLDPGTVVVIDEMGTVMQSQHAYDKKVAGVISGAGDFKPAIILGKQDSEQNRVPIALMGRVYCKVDAQYGALAVGDLLTTSDTPGHAMKAGDQTRAFGAVIGKALGALGAGRGCIPILVSLQ